jgi:predicted amidophosphoribosyltransferase
VAALHGHHGILAATAAYRARPAAAQPLVAYKERQEGWQDLEAPLALALQESVSSHDLRHEPLIVPVPSYRGRRPHVRTLTRLLPDVESKLDLLRKVHDIRQTGLGRRARREQSQGAYRVRWGARVRDRTVIVTDDILTTGATLEACATALTAAGAAAVYGATILRVVLPPPVLPVVIGDGQISVRFTEPNRRGEIPCSGDGNLWVRFGCGPSCPYMLTAGPLRTPTAHIDVDTSWLCRCGARHAIQVARLGTYLRVTVPPRRPPELMLALQIPAL